MYSIWNGKLTLKSKKRLERTDRAMASMAESGTTANQSQSVFTYADNRNFIFKYTSEYISNKLIKIKYFNPRKKKKLSFHSPNI